MLGRFAYELHCDFAAWNSRPIPLCQVLEYLSPAFHHLGSLSVILTLILVLLAIATLFLAGYGPTLLLLDRKPEYSRFTVMPISGLACYIVLAHSLASLHLTGGWISLVASLVFGGLFVAVPRVRRLDREEFRQSLPVLAISCAGMIFAAWPLLHDGYNSYLAFGNADAAFNLTVFDDLQHHRYGEQLSSSLPYWSNTQFGLLFGVGYICILIARATGTNILKLHEVVSAGVVFAAPTAVFLFSIICLKAPRRTALIATAASAFSSLVCYTFYLQSLGAMTFIALLPAVLAAWSQLLETHQTRHVLWAALLFTGTSFGYYAGTPVIAALFAVAAAVAMIKRVVRWQDLLQWGGIVAAVAIISFPALTVATLRRSLLEAGSSRLAANLNGPEVLLSFAFALTEQYLPFFWGISIPPFAWDSLFEPPKWGALATLGFSILLTGVLVGLLFWRWPPPVYVRAQVAVLLTAIVYFVYQGNGYGAFKLAAWFSPVFLPFLVCGVAPDPASSGTRLWLSRCRYFVLISLTSLNMAWAIYLGHASLRNSGATGKSMSGFSGKDFDGLRSLSKIVPAGSRVLLAIPHAVIQRWALTYTKSLKISVLPYLSLSPDEADAAEQLAASGAASARYILTWSAVNQDIVPSRRYHTVWQNAKFRLLPAETTRDFLIVGRGWYPMEALPESTQAWQHRFRWLRSNGELILLNASGKDMRLRLTMVSGYGQTSPLRSVTIALNGEKFDQFDISGTAAVITKPFRAQGFINRLSLILPDTASPVPRSWGLFNRWVPKDGRRLNVAVSKVELMADDEYRAMRLPCRLDLSRPDAWDTPSLNGLYADHWVAGQAHVSLEPCGEPTAISIRGFIPDLPQSRPPFPITVVVNAVPHRVEVNKPGPFQIGVPLSPSVRGSAPYDIVIGGSRTFVPAELGLGPDRRRLSIMLDSIEIQSRAKVAPQAIKATIHKAGTS